LAEEQGPQNTIQFITMMIKGIITGIPKMIKSSIVTAIISGAVTLGLHFYLILVPNDGYNSSGNPFLDSILVLGNVNPTPPNVLLFWFLGNYLFWWVIGTFKEKGIVGGIKQFVTTPVFVVKSLRDSGFGAFPMILGGLGFAMILRLWILGTMTTLQMLLLTIGVLVSQTDSIALIGMQLFFNDLKKLANRGRNFEPPVFGLAATMILGAVIGFAYLAYFPYDTQMVQILAALMILGLIGMFVQGRRKGNSDRLAMVLMLLCLFTLAIHPVNADDGGAAENGGAMNVINNASLRNYMIRQGINPALAGIAAALLAQGRLTPSIFDQLRKGKIKATKDMSLREMETMFQVRDQLLHNLQHMDHEIWFGKAQHLWQESGSPGDIRKHIDSLIDDIIHGREVDLNHYSKVYNVYTDHVTGRTITEDMIPTESQLNREMWNDFASGVSREVFTMRDADGNFSYAGLGLRLIAGGLTGGMSDFAVYIPMGGMYSYHDARMAGADEWEAIKYAGKHTAMETGMTLVFMGGAHLVGKAAPYAGEFLAETFPNATRVVKNGVTYVDDVMHTEINLWPRGTKPGLPRGGQYKPSGEVLDDYLNSQRSGQPAPGLDEVKFKDWMETDTPNMVGRDMTLVQEAGDVNDAVIVMRETNPASQPWIKAKAADPKPLPIKAKTVNEYDRLLGFDDTPFDPNFSSSNEGLVACKNPKLPPKPPEMSPAEYNQVIKRYVQRRVEYMDNKAYYESMERQGLIDWNRETGVISNPRTGRPFAGDNDPFAYLDPDTLQPVNAYRSNTINSNLQQSGVTLHNEHIGFQTHKYMGTDSYGQMATIDESILSNPGELWAYNPRDGGKWFRVTYDGSTTRNWGTWLGQGGN
jgi:hypothetical protein